MTVIIFIVILAVLILVHEWGHFYAAKRSGIRVDEFGLGFPPRIAGKRVGETLYSLNWLPFGGFVKIFGEDPSEEDILTADRDRSFFYQRKHIQAFVIVAGVICNWLLAVVLLSLAFMVGVPASTEAFPEAVATNQRVIVTQVFENTPAEIAGLSAGDEILRVVARNGQTSEIDPLESSEISDFVQNRAGEELEFYVKGADGEEGVINVSPELVDALGENLDLEEGRAYIGIAMESVADIKLPVHRAVAEGFVGAYDLTIQTVKGLSALFIGIFDGTAKLEQVSGPVGIATFVGSASREGLGSLFFLVALISINLAVINLFPFPALDGGRLLFVIIEAIKGSPIKRSVANWANLIGFFLLIALLLVVTYHDIIKLI